MSESKHCEPAFPRDHRHQGHSGLTMRDYFAAAALPIVAPGCYMAGRPFLEYKNFDDAAGDAYRLADAMIAARSQP